MHFPSVHKQAVRDLLAKLDEVIQAQPLSGLDLAKGKLGRLLYHFYYYKEFHEARVARQGAQLLTEILDHFLKDSLHGEPQGLGLLDAGSTAGKNSYRAGLGVSGALLLACQYCLAHKEEELPGSVAQAIDCLAGRFTQSIPGKPGLFDGVAGILFGLSHVYRHFPGKKLEQLLDQGLHALLASVRKTYLPLPPDLADGYAGILLGAAYCYHQTQHSLCPEIMNEASERLLAGAKFWENAVVWDYHIHHNHFIIILLPRLSTGQPVRLALPGPCFFRVPCCRTTAGPARQS